MFCPKCGNADQTSDTFCRQCGTFLPNLEKLIKKETAPEEHLTANSFFSVMTIVVSFTLAALLYSILAFRTDTHWLVYVTAGFLLAIGGWHIQTFVRTRKLAQQFKQRGRFVADPENEDVENSGRVIGPGNPEYIPVGSVTERTTRDLAGAPLRSPKAEQ